MSVGKRIKYFRIAKGLTQKSLGVNAGINENADVRIAQYESGGRTPKADMMSKLAAVLDVDIKAIDPDIDTYSGVMHTLFLPEDEYGLRIARNGGELCLSFDPHISESFRLKELVSEWAAMAYKLNVGEISKEEYDNWRYRYSENA